MTHGRILPKTYVDENTNKANRKINFKIHSTIFDNKNKKYKKLLKSEFSQEKLAE